LAKIDEIKKIINEKRSEVKDFDDEIKLMTPLGNLSSALNELKKIKNVKNNTGIDPTNLEIYLSKLSANHQDSNPQINYTLYPLIAELPIEPYSKTTDYFGGGVGSTIQIERGGGKPQTTLPANYVFTSMYPGSISHRWVYNKIRIPCGQYYDGFVSHLQGLHELSKSPIFSFRGKDVFEIKKITGVPLDSITKYNFGNIPICPRCLSISVQSGPHREQCDHIRDQTESRERIKNIQSTPTLKTVEKTDQRKISESKNFSFPINEIFEKIEFLENTQILTVAIGFSRQASWGRGINARSNSVQVEYDPYVGYKMDTNGLVFKLKEIPDNFIEDVIGKSFLVRDVLIDIFAERIEKIITDHDRSVFELELWLSGIIKTLGLDTIDESFDYESILKNLSTQQFKNTFYENILREISYYAHRPRNIEPALITSLSEEISSLKISIDDLKSKVKSLLKNSLSYLIYMSGLITSGSTSRDIDFVYPQEENNDIVVFDNVSDGNGASKLINNYLIGKNKAFSQEQGLRPKYLEETIFELLLPCSQGISERIYFQNLHDGFSNFTKNDLITYRLKELRDQNESSTNEFNQIINSRIENMFPISIGKRPLIRSDATDDGTENKKIQEIANICVHGCPECILLNSFSGPSIPRLERFYVSKYLVDMYFKFVTEKIRVRYDANTSDIENILKQHGMVIISQQISGHVHDFNQLMTKVNSLIGEKFDEKLVKFSGIWFDCPISNAPEVEISVLLGLIK